jgi:SAM-dependent methyltransferase
LITQPRGDEIHAKFGNLSVFNSQFNIGHEVYARWSQRGKFGIDRNKMFSKLNLIFVGPSFSDLRDQTIHDLAELAKELKLFGDVSQGQLMKHVQNMVFNSSSLKEKLIKKRKGANQPDDRENEPESDEEVGEVVDEALPPPPPKECNQQLSHIPFITGLQADTKCEHLHLIIHDEAHWGIKAESLLEKFFLRVLSVLGDFDQLRRPTVLLLLVSATAEVLTWPVKEFDPANKQPNMYTVDWNGLNRSGMPQFEVSSYRAVDHLKYVNDLDTTTRSLEDGSEVKLVAVKGPQRSQCVCAQYKAAAEDLSELIGSARESAGRVSLVDAVQRTPAHQAMASLLFSQNSEATADFSELQTGYEFDTGRNRVVLVRVSFIEDANELARNVISAFRDRCGFLPFEVISLGGNGNIAEQLSEGGSRYLSFECGETVQKYSRVAILQHIPTLLIVVKKLQMGERLPSSCCYYDVRVPYRGRYDNVQTGNQTQFVQDVGRLAGHKNNVAMPVVFLALEAVGCALDSPQLNGHPYPVPKFAVIHNQLTGGVKQEVTKEHAEHITNERVYTKMLPFSVLLNAPPQVGKTGSFLAVIEIIVAKHITDGAYVPPPPPMVDVTPAKPLKLFSFADDIGDVEGTFAQRCKFLRHLLRTRGMDKLKEVMTGEYFKEYHRLLLDSREGNGTNTNDHVVDKILKLSADLSQNTWRILDCGCGIHGLAPSLNAALQSGNPKKVKQLTDVYVRGIDLDDAIVGCVSCPHKVLRFDPLVNDVLSVPADEEGYDMVVFNCSLWEKSNFRVLSRANENLRPGGHLVIVELKRRLPKTWTQDMLDMGWAISEEFGRLQFSVFEFDPYTMSVWQKPSTGHLNHGCDLTMDDF